MAFLFHNTGLAKVKSNLLRLDEEPHHCFFKKNSVSIGLGGIYSLNQYVTGINSRVYYNVKEHLCFGPEVSIAQEGEISITDYNIVSHYIFDIKHIGFYPLVGVNYTQEVNHNKKHEAVGFVFGAGIHRNIGKLTIFTEYKQVQSSLQDKFITAGFMFTIH